jgi:hypothetical protein
MVKDFGRDRKNSKRKGKGKYQDVVWKFFFMSDFNCKEKIVD